MKGVDLVLRIRLLIQEPRCIWSSSWASPSLHMYGHGSDVREFTCHEINPKKEAKRGETMIYLTEHQIVRSNIINKVLEDLLDGPNCRLVLASLSKFFGYGHYMTQFQYEKCLLCGLNTPSNTFSVLKYLLHFGYGHYSSFKLILYIAANVK